MRIAFIANNSYAAWGGSEELWSLTALRLHRKGISVMACVQNWKPMPPRLREFQRAGLAMHTIKPKRTARLRESVRAALRREPKRDFHHSFVEEFLSPFRPDLVVISQMQNYDGAQWAAACRRCGLPYAMVAQAASEMSWPEDWIWATARDALVHARRSYFVSRQNAELTSRQFGLALPRAEVISNPFQVNFDQAANWPQPSDTFRLACVARIEPPSKGHDLILELLAQPKWRQRPLTISFYGDGRNRQSVVQLAKHLALRSVEFSGHTADVAAVWRSHHALILASRLEGTPLALIEAMICHRLGIVTNVGGNADLVEDNISGFVAANPSVEALDEAMERAWNCRDDWRKIGLAAGRRIRACVPSDPVAAFAERLEAAAADHSGD